MNKMEIALVCLSVGSLVGALIAKVIYVLQQEKRDNEAYDRWLEKKERNRRNRL